MHIPDGYLSPATSAVLGTACIPFLAKASGETNAQLNAKRVPLIALFSALSFVIMMFNVPLPGGTTGHATGAAIAAIVLGPWAAMLSVTVALVIQALFFGDGGILTLGANIFNIAIIIPMTAAAVFGYARRAARGNKRTTILFSAIAGYISANVAALITALELGIQPILFHTASGQSLYFPYGLGVAIPAMMIGHLTVAGLAEGVVTGLTLSWFYKANPALTETDSAASPTAYRFGRTSFIFIVTLILLTPLGLLAPGTAWGEWGREELAQFGLGYIPAGFDRWANFWSAPLADYNLPRVNNPTIAYVFSAIAGAALSFALILGSFGFVRYIARRLKHHVIS